VPVGCNNQRYHERKKKFFYCCGFVAGVLRMGFIPTHCSMKSC
jgi:hypothetical protein